jgi:hypothetical protein
VTNLTAHSFFFCYDIHIVGKLLIEKFFAQQHITYA